MDMVYQKDTTFTDIAAQIATTSDQNHINTIQHTQMSHTLLFSELKSQTQTPYASSIKTYLNNNSDVTVIPNHLHVTSNNANDVVDVAQVIDQVITSQGELMKLCDSIHA